MLTPGQTIGHYELVCRIGDGGMAHVWAARSTAANSNRNTLVALKIIHSRYAEHAEFRTMFLDEGRIVSAIEHRNVARVFELCESATSNGQLLYLVMEYVDGESLFSLTAPARTVPMPIALRIAADACAGLHAVHRVVDARGELLNVVHRDVSPQNILLTLDGDVKLIDFGIAHARDRAITTTDASMVKGKVRYMAPEQARREALGPFTDVFGIGATLFRLLTGRAPYAASTEIETMQALLANAPPTSRLPEDMPEAVTEVVLKAIAPDIRDRYITAKQLEDDLRALVAREYLPPDVAKWVTTNLSDQARRRHAELMASPRVDLPLPTGPDAIVTARPPPIVTAPMPVVPPQQPIARVMPPAATPPAVQGVAPSAERARSFMDVGALAAKAASSPQTPAPFGGGVRAGKPAAYGTASGAPAPKGKTASSSTGTSKPIKIAIAAVVLVVIAVVVLLLLPRIFRERAIATARDAGFLITIDRVGVDFSGATFRGITVKVAHTPGITATIQEIHTTMLGAETRILGMDARLEGKRSDIDAGIAALLMDNRARFAGAPNSPRHLSIVSARVTWDGIYGEGSKLLAGDIGVELDSRGAGVEDVKSTVGRFDIHMKREAVANTDAHPANDQDPTATAAAATDTAKEIALGPWGASFERNPTSSRVRLLLDPVVPDGPSALIVWGRVAPVEVTIRIPRSPFSNLGIRPSDFGLPASASSEIDVNVHGKFPMQDRSEVKGEILLAGVKPAGFRAPMEVRIEGSAGGPPGGPLDIEKTTVSVGPFIAVVTGTVTPHEAGNLGARLEANFKALPIPCVKIAQAEAKSMGALAATLQALGQTTGAFRVTGIVNASGVVKYDTATPEEASLTFLTKETCGVSIFGM